MAELQNLPPDAEVDVVVNLFGTKSHLGVERVSGKRYGNKAKAMIYTSN